jgi:hypothetical protein
MKINSQALSTCEVVPDEDAISLGLIDAIGSSSVIRLSLDQASALLMTLSALIDTALQRSFRDRSLRYAYPLTSWSVDQVSDPPQCVVTLRTHSGFSACFSVQLQQQIDLGEALAWKRPQKTADRAN